MRTLVHRHDGATKAETKASRKNERPLPPSLSASLSLSHDTATKAETKALSFKPKRWTEAFIIYARG